MKSQMKGFTLIEVLVALAVFAILASITSSAMYYAFNTKARVSAQAERIVNLQLAFVLMQRDIVQVDNRPVRTNQMRLLPAFVGQSNYLELTRSGLPNPNSTEKRSTMKRLGIGCKGSQLIRRSWDRLDLTDKTKFEERILIHGVTRCKFSYLSKEHQFLNEWRINNALPQAVQVSLTLEGGNEMAWLFVLPEGLYGA